LPLLPEQMGASLTLYGGSVGSDEHQRCSSSKQSTTCQALSQHRDRLHMRFLLVAEGEQLNCLSLYSQARHSATPSAGEGGTCHLGVADWWGGWCVPPSTRGRPLGVTLFSSYIPTRCAEVVGATREGKQRRCASPLHVVLCQHSQLWRWVEVDPSRVAAVVRNVQHSV